MTDPLADGLLALATSVAADAAALIRGRMASPRLAAGTKTSPTDMVTETDRAAEALIVGALLAARPGDGILAEEGSERASLTGVRWVIDPLDGTTNFLYGVPAFAVRVAAERDGEVLAGVVHDVPHGQAYTASRGGGAFCDGVPLHVTARAELATALVGTGFGYVATRRAEQAAIVARVLPLVRDIRRIGAAALDLCAVAAGRLDGYYERGVQPWDVAAGALIVREAGGLAGWEPGQDPPTFVAAGPALHPLLAAAVRLP